MTINPAKKRMSYEFLIRSAYRLTLGRDADEDGIKNYSNSMLHGMKIREVIEDLKKSEEYKSKRTTSPSNDYCQHWRDFIDLDSIPALH